MANVPKNLAVYEVDPDKGIINRTQNGTTEEVAGYDPASGIVTLSDPKWRLPVIKHLQDKGWLYNGLSEDALKDDIPPKPRMNPRLGDKTPGVIEWMARYQPREFKARFGVKTLQRRTGYNRWTAKIRDEETGKWIDVQQEEPIYENLPHLNYDVDKLLSGDQRLLADRKSAFTEKLSTELDTENYDWDLDKTVEDRRADGGNIPQVRMVRG